MMVIWNAPKDVENHEFCAMECALEMMKRLKTIRESDFEKFGKVYIRIGIYTAESLIGNVGAPDRINYTALGDGVNLASRLEGINKRFHTRIIIGDTTYDAIKMYFKCKWLDYLAVKGKELPVDVYELVCRMEDTSPLIDQACDSHKQMRNALKLGDFDTVKTICEETLKHSHDHAAELLLERMNEDPQIVCRVYEK
ncbi:adenylate cyclase [Acrasis kona]|uniref:Adenylate cyclase n=1 Tax=Acrasis kona TaxID=1008807 RepID=A0AAW2ZN96_9EUKA